HPPETKEGKRTVAAAAGNRTLSGCLSRTGAVPFTQLSRRPTAQRPGGLSTRDAAPTAAATAADSTDTAATHRRAGYKAAPCPAHTRWRDVLTLPATVTMIVP